LFCNSLASSNCVPSPLVSAASVQDKLVWRIDIGDNRLTDAVAPDLAALLASNDALHELDVSGNQMTVVGMVAFVDVLARAPTRVTLDGNDDACVENILA
jgi:hypothetical protein